MEILGGGTIILCTTVSLPRDLSHFFIFQKISFIFLYCFLVLIVLTSALHYFLPFAGRGVNYAIF